MNFPKYYETIMYILTCEYPSEKKKNVCTQLALGSVCH